MDADGAEEVRNGLAERAARAKRLRAAYDAAMLDRDAYALAVQASGVLKPHEIGAFLSDSDSHASRRVRINRIGNEWESRLRKFRERYPDIVIPQY
jgi:hypothetical protein